MDSDKSSHCPFPRPPHNTLRNNLLHFSFPGRKYQNLTKIFFEVREMEKEERAWTPGDAGTVGILKHASPVNLSKEL